MNSAPCCDPPAASIPQPQAPSIPRFKFRIPHPVIRVLDNAYPGETSLNVSSVRLFGEYGEDLAWKSEVQAENGVFTVLSGEDDADGDGIPNSVEG